MLLSPRWFSHTYTRAYTLQKLAKLGNQSLGSALSICSCKVRPDVTVIWSDHYYVHGYIVSCVCRCCLCWEDGEFLLSIILSATAAVSARQSFSQSTIRSLLRLEAVAAADASGGCCC